MDAISAEGFTDIDIGKFPVEQMFTLDTAKSCQPGWKTLSISVSSKWLKQYLPMSCAFFHFSENTPESPNYLTVLKCTK